jgi:F-type H+-transporting ATPase subunit epsilon
MKLKIITPQRIVLETDDIEAVYVKTIDGEVGILPKHVPLVAPLDITLLRYVKAGNKEVAAVMGGILRTNGEEISILSDSAELAAEIDVVRAQNAKERAESRIRQQQTDVQIDRAKASLTRSLTRLKATQAQK